ncbi:MAG: chemotaxis protein CheW [Planctomycetota bacterium]
MTRQTMPAGPDVRRSGPAGGLRSFAEATEHETQVVTFQLAKEEYAIDILQVQEIVMMTKITRMPKAPHFIEGIVNLRGQMIPIIDMRKRFSLGEAVHDADTRIIIVDIGEIVGMVVDGVRDVIRLADSAISPPPPIIKGISAEYLKGIGQFNDRLLIMLELEKVLSAEEHEMLRKLGPDGCPLDVDVDALRSRIVAGSK